jgi:hypothetical protein
MLKRTILPAHHDRKREINREAIATKSLRFLPTDGERSLRWPATNGDRPPNGSLER